MRYALVVVASLLAACLIASMPNAQVGLPWPGPGAASGGGGGSGRPLQLGIGTPTVAVGLRALSDAWADGTHKAGNIIRTSDNHTCDVLITSGDVLGNTTGCSTGGDNGTAITSWCSGNCFVNTWYDQSGTGNDLAHTNNQAVFNPNATVSSVNVNFDLTNSHTGPYCTSGTISEPQIVSISAVVNVASSANFRTVASFDTTVSQVGGANASGKAFIFGGTVATGNMTDSAYHAMAYVLNNAGTSHIYTDTTDETLSTTPGAGNSTAAKICIGAVSDNTNQFDGNIREVIVWPNASASAFLSEVNALSSNQHTYWGF